MKKKEVGLSDLCEMSADLGDGQPTATTTWAVDDRQRWLAGGGGNDDRVKAHACIGESMGISMRNSNAPLCCQMKYIH